MPLPISLERVMLSPQLLRVQSQSVMQLRKVLLQVLLAVTTHTVSLPRQLLRM
jgi:hypothetical protein